MRHLNVRLDDTNIGIINGANNEELRESLTKLVSIALFAEKFIIPTLDIFGIGEEAMEASIEVLNLHESVDSEFSLTISDTLIFNGMDKHDFIKLLKTDIKLFNDLVRGFTAKNPSRLLDLGWSDLTNYDLRGACFDNVDLSNVIMNDVNLEGVSLRNTNLQLADIQDANLNKVDLTTANLSRAVFSDSSMIGAKLSGALMFETLFDGVNLTGAQLDNVSANCANFTRADLTNTNLTGARLTNTLLTKAILTGATISDSTALIGASTTLDVGNLGINYADSHIIQQLYHMLSHVSNSTLISKGLKDLLLTDALVNKSRQYHVEV